MLCKSPALSLLHLLRSLSGPQTASVKICRSGSGTRLRLNTSAKEESLERARVASQLVSVPYSRRSRWPSVAASRVSSA